MADPPGRHTVRILPGLSGATHYYDATGIADLYKGRPIDPRVEKMVVTFEFYLRAAPNSQQIQRTVVLKHLPELIDSSNMDEFIWFLSLRGTVDEFFDLIRQSVDRDRALRTLLETNGITPERIRYLAAWGAFQPFEFANGFWVGVGESVAMLVTGVIDFLRLLNRLSNEVLVDEILLVVAPQQGFERVVRHAKVVIEVFWSIVEGIDPRKLPAAVVTRWRAWNEEFTTHLENLDSFEAGRHLGRIAGELWQLLTGIVGLARLLRMGGTLARKYAPLLIGSVRKAAAEAAILIKDLAEVLVAIGRKTIDGIARVGLDVLRTLFPPSLWRELLSGRPLIARGQLLFTPVYQEAYVSAFGSAMGNRFGVLASVEGRPLFMAALNERLPDVSPLKAVSKGQPRSRVSAPKPVSPAEEEKLIDEIIEKLETFPESPGAKLPPPGSPIPEIVAVAEGAAKLAQLEQRMASQVSALLQRIAYEEFGRMVKSGERFNGGQFGTAVHTRMAQVIEAEVVAHSPGAKVVAQKSLRTALKEIASDAPALKGKRATDRLEQSVAKILIEHKPEALDALGYPKDATARTEKAIAKWLSEEFRWKPPGSGKATQAGDLVSDTLVIDPKARRVVNVDYTSATNLENFEKLYKTVYGDLGKRFDGDWTGLAAAYEKAGREMPAKVAEQLQALTWHAGRETVVRKSVLEYTFGEGWNITSHEFLYKSLAEFWNPTRGQTRTLY